jgi:Mlc titration factor MtfA (ptsG expression regulator)
MLTLWKQARRRRVSARPFPGAWHDALARNVAHYPLLPPALQRKLREDLSVLVAEKYWEGCGGFEVTDEVKVTVAAQACLTLLGRRDHDYFGRAPSVLVYPSAFAEPAPDGGPPRYGWAGQSVYRGPVILAWDRVLAEGRDPAGGCNLVVHEFAHQLDDLDGSANGTPALATDAEHAGWARVMTAEYVRLLRDLRRGRETFLGGYAGSNETEFFAVASERFFTLPGRLRHYHPALYDLLRGYYCVDPREWFGEAGAGAEPIAAPASGGAE